MPVRMVSDEELDRDNNSSSNSSSNNESNNESNNGSSMRNTASDSQGLIGSLMRNLPMIISVFQFVMGLFKKRR